VDPDSGWRSLFAEAFRRSANAMVLLDGRRRVVEINGSFLQLVGYRRDAITGREIYDFMIGGATASESEWRAALREDRLTGTAVMRRADGGRVRIDFAGHPALATGQQLVLFVAMNASRRAARVQGRPIERGQTGALSAREVEVVRMIALGASGTEIATALQLTHNTIRTHVRNSMTKLGARSRAQLVAMSLAEGLVLGEELDFTDPQFTHPR
jgi:PAS domain S-box-containing protein